jgi:hypothetical protein
LCRQSPTPVSIFGNRLGREPSRKWLDAKGCEEATQAIVFVFEESGKTVQACKADFPKISAMPFFREKIPTHAYRNHMDHRRGSIKKAQAGSPGLFNDIEYRLSSGRRRSLAARG